MGEKETSSRLASTPAEGGAGLRPGDPIPDIDRAPGAEPPSPSEATIVKSKSNITNN